MSKRINIILPDTTVAVLNRVTTKGNRSRFIDRAVRRLVAIEGKANLRTRLKAEAIENAARDLEIAAEWFPLEQETIQTLTSTTANSTAKKPRRFQRR